MATLARGAGKLPKKWMQARKEMGCIHWIRVASGLHCVNCVNCVTATQWSSRVVLSHHEASEVLSLGSSSEMWPARAGGGAPRELNICVSFLFFRLSQLKSIELDIIGLMWDSVGF